MRTPCEVVVQELLPQIRARIAARLIEKHKWKQVDVAKVLMVSQASVAKYKKILKRETSISESKLDEVADYITERILNNTMTPISFIDKVCWECFNMRVGGEICRIHKTKLPILRELNCDICSQHFIKRPEIVSRKISALDNVNMALKILHENPNFVKLIPEVRSNIVMATENAQKIEDVVAIPGRITELKGRPYPVGYPEFGASKHVASLILTIMRIFKNIRAGVCIKYDGKIDEIFRKLNLDVLYIDRSKIKDLDILLHLERILKDREHPPDVVVDLGDVGLEAVSYIIDVDATTAVKKTLKIAEKY
ncbi:MAG: hypothetical protein J7L47_05875 [Candidatus Odinarchaeota archaeon]|nr:hypothetical protein [Candidatus Odinarchaeota archaeon]